MTTAERLRQTVHVSEDGAVTHGISVPHTGANIRGDTRFRAWVPRTARTSLFRHNAGIPGDVWVGDRRTDILGATGPHNCENHLPTSERVEHQSLAQARSVRQWAQQEHPGNRNAPSALLYWEEAK